MFSSEFGSASAWMRVAVVIGVAVGAHVCVFLIRRGIGFLILREQLVRRPKARSILGLVSSAAIFALYFSAIGVCLNEFGVSLTAYFASATVIGLAVGFGSQGLVQDVVTGLTLIFSDLIDVDDMVELNGQTGIVRSIGMRFVLLENPLGAQVYISNRSVGNVVNYPKGYIRCLVDITLPEDASIRASMEARAALMMENFRDQYPGILVAPPSIDGVRNTTSGKTYLRLKFRIWPGRGGPLETLFRQELIKAMQQFNPDFQDWMVSVFYETERPLSVSQRRAPRSARAR